MSENKTSSPPQDFIRAIISDDLKANKNDGRVVTRFPPEPNGYLHIGHAKSICLNFDVAEENRGLCYLRFDDTNPTKESEEYIDSIQKSVRWLGFDWEDRLTYASDYFDYLYQCAIRLIKKSKAYVCRLSPEETREYRGTLTQPGKNSPYRDSSPEENLKLFEQMKNGEFEAGECVLRAKIDMTSPNMNMRDPVIYRILKIPHIRSKDKWVVYPMYDFTHCVSDSREGISHSLCTLEFEDHRPLYEWFLEELNEECRPRQIEFSRLSLNYTITSKRHLNRLIQDGHVSGWDDPRMPTLTGLRRRGYTPDSIKNFCRRVGITKQDNNIEMSFLENCLREDLENKAPRAMAVLRPLELVIDNYPDGQTEELEASRHPNNLDLGKRKIPFSKVLYIERDDFREDPPKKFFRLAPGKEVRLRHAYIIKCVDAVKDEKTGEIIRLHCVYDPETKSGSAQSSRKVKGTLHWVSAEHSLKAEVRIYDRLFNKPRPTDKKDGLEFKDKLNPDSIEILSGCRLEASLADVSPEDRLQFERQGYFCADRFDHAPDKPVFNRTAALRDTWAKLEKAEKQKQTPKKKKGKKKKQKQTS